MSSETPTVVNSDPSENGAEEESSSVHEATETEPKDTPPKKKRRGRWFLFLLILVLLLASAGGGWYFTQEQWRAQQAEAGQALGGQLAELEVEIQALRDQVSAQAQRQENIETALVASAQESEAQLLSLAERLSQAESTSSGDWELAEAEYLLRIANQRLVTSLDIEGAIEMMAAADNILRELAYPELAEARRQLVADITRLELVQPVDYEGIYFALDALLPLVAGLSGSEIERLEGLENDAAAEQGWRGYWSAITNSLGRYVVINSPDETEPQYLISDEKESLVKSEIQLQIRQAQLAMLAGETALYEAALNGAAETIQRVFVQDGQSGSLASSLRNLAARSIAGETVDISGSIRAVEKVVDQMTRIQYLGQPSEAQ